MVIPKCKKLDILLQSKKDKLDNFFLENKNGKLQSFLISLYVYLEFEAFFKKSQNEFRYYENMIKNLQVVNLI